MSHPRISVFAGSAKGNQAAVRVIEGQATLMARTTHDISVDTVHDELALPNPFAEAILKASAITKLTSSFGGVALNPEARELMVVDNEHPAALLVYRLPEVFRSVTPSPKGEAPISSLR